MLALSIVGSFLCRQKNEPKEKAADHLVRLRRTARSLCPVFKGAVQNNRALRNSLRSGSPRAIQIIFPLLSYVKRPLYAELKQVIHSGNTLLSKNILL